MLKRLNMRFTCLSDLEVVKYGISLSAMYHRNFMNLRSRKKIARGVHVLFISFLMCLNTVF